MDKYELTWQKEAQRLGEKSNQIGSIIATSTYSGVSLLLSFINENINAITIFYFIPIITIFLGVFLQQKKLISIVIQGFNTCLSLFFTNSLITAIIVAKNAPPNSIFFSILGNIPIALTFSLLMFWKTKYSAIGIGLGILSNPFFYFLFNENITHNIISAWSITLPICLGGIGFTWLRYEPIKKNFLMTQELNSSKNEIERKNRTILESIYYAKRIQDAVMPNETETLAIFEQSFVFFRPKDIVSGDFWWISYHQEQKILALVDCTGHGVSGSLMSIIGANTLHRIVFELKIIQAAVILSELDHHVRQILKQNSRNQSLNDGMDISLCIFEDNILHFAAAKRSIFISQNNTISEIKGDKFPIGSSFYEEKRFSEQSFQLQKNDMVYMFTDGITDQFDTENHKKFGKKRLMTLCNTIQNMPINSQKQALEQEISKWQGQTKQTDDMLLIGIKI